MGKQRVVGRGLTMPARALQLSDKVRRPIGGAVPAVERRGHCLPVDSATSPLGSSPLARHQLTQKP